MSLRDTGNVRLVKLEDAPYREYRENLIRAYAADKVRAGAWSQTEAESRATKDVDGLLPQGPNAHNNFLFSVRDESAEVGIVWFALRDSGVGRSVWIYDIIIHEGFRRRGYASRTLELVEDMAKKLGARSVRLHGFSHNHGAQALYEKIGYTATSLTVAKAVQPEQG